MFSALYVVQTQTPGMAVAACHPAATHAIVVAILLALCTPALLANGKCLLCNVADHCGACCPKQTPSTNPFLSKHFSIGATAMAFQEIPTDQMRAIFDIGRVVGMLLNNQKIGDAMFTLHNPDDARTLLISAVSLAENMMIHGRITETKTAELNAVILRADSLLDAATYEIVSVAGGAVVAEKLAKLRDCFDVMKSNLLGIINY
jgi:hypothetical protein